MGRYYAEAHAEAPAIWLAIRDHYAPQGPSNQFPTGPVGVAVALADKLDTLAGFFAIDERPTGSKDPFALRRAALGIRLLIVESVPPLRLSLGDADYGGTRRLSATRCRKSRGWKPRATRCFPSSPTGSRYICATKVSGTT